MISALRFPHSDVDVLLRSGAAGVLRPAVSTR